MSDASLSDASLGFSPPFVQDNHNREVQELRQLRRLQELEQKRHSWATGELVGFSRSSSENDVEHLGKKGAEDLPLFLHRRPVSPSCRRPNTRRSRLSLGASADRELLTFLENSVGSPEEANKFNSLPRSSPRQVRPAMAWRESGEPRDQGSGRTHRPQASAGQEGAPDPPSASYGQLLAPQMEDSAPVLLRTRTRRSGQGMLQKRNSEPVALASPWSPPLSPLALGIKEHELVTGLAQFDVQGPKDPEETPRQSPTNFSPVELASPADGSLQPLGAGTGAGIGAGSGSLTPVGTGAQGSLRAALQGEEAAPDEHSINPENKDPGPLFYFSDTTDCSLTLDCSEETDARPGGGELGEAGQGDGSLSSGAGEAGGSQVSSNPLSSPPGETPASAKSGPSCRGGLSRDRSSKGKEVTTPKRNSLKEASQGAPKPGAVPRGQGTAPKPVRTLTSSESESMRKVVPISRASRGSAGWKQLPREPPSSTQEPWSRRNSVKGTSDTSPKRSSKGPGVVAEVTEEQRPPRGRVGSCGNRPGKEPALQPKGSLKKPSAKPLRNVPRQKPEENKICRSNSQDPQSPGEEPKPPPPTPSVPRVPSQVPGFARNTVASSSRFMKTDSLPVSKAPGLTRTVSQRQLRVKGGSEDAVPKDSGTLRRAYSSRAPKKGPESAEGPGANTEASLKGRGTGERTSFRQKDSSRTTLGKILNPLWK